MKPIIAAVFLLSCESVLAHPGHGAPGILHEHTVADILLVLLFLCLCLTALALACRAALKRSRQR